MGQVLWEIWGHNDNIQMTLNFLYYPNSDAQVTPVTTKSPSRLGGGGHSLFLRISVSAFIYMFYSSQKAWWELSEIEDIGF